jgi:hypothetical protein
MAGLFAGLRPAPADHGGGHCKYVFKDESGTPVEIAFKDGRKMSGLLFVMGNKADELMVEIGDTNTYSNVFLQSIRRIERRREAGQRHILDFTAASGETFPVYSHPGNVIFVKAAFGIIELHLPEVQSIVMRPMPAAAASAEKADECSHETVGLPGAPKSAGEPQAQTAAAGARARAGLKPPVSKSVRDANASIRPSTPDRERRGALAFLFASK